MADDRQYARAPITEAIIDLRVSAPTELCARDLHRAQQGEQARYPHVEPLNVAVGQFRVGPQVSTSASTEHVGFSFRSEDGKQVYQARVDGFTMSRLAPYERWETFRDEARRLWDIYKRVAGPGQVLRVAVRYINRIDMPLPLNDFKDYLRTAPEVSSDLPQELAGYFLRLAIPLEDIQGTCLVNETIIDPATAGVVSVVLDIDVFRTEDLPEEEASLWDLMDVLRRKKNQVFEACITDKARELFK